MPGQRTARVEWGLVGVLVRHPGKLVTRELILRTVWGEGFDDESGDLRVHMGSVRRKLEPTRADPATS